MPLYISRGFMTLFNRHIFFSRSFTEILGDSSLWYRKGKVFRGCLADVNFSWTDLNILRKFIFVFLSERFQWENSHAKQMLKIWARVDIIKCSLCFFVLKSQVNLNNYIEIGCPPVRLSVSSHLKACAYAEILRKLSYLLHVFL